MLCVTVVFVYARSIIERRLEIVERKLGFRPEYHSISEVDDFNKRLQEKYADAYAVAGRSARGSGDGTVAFQNSLITNLSPKLNSDEIRWIQNERALSWADAEYWLTHYYWIKTQTALIRFEFRAGQRVYLHVIQRLQELGAPIELIMAKARQLGISTVTEGLIVHSVNFGIGVNAVVASADEGKTGEMSKMTFLGYDSMDWWLKAPYSRRVESNRGMLVLGGLKSSISFQHGAQMSGIGRGSTFLKYHLSEVASYNNASYLIEAALFKCVHPHPDVFGVLESTAEGNTGWFYDTYSESKAKRMAGDPTRLVPLFLPFTVAPDQYPNKTWIRTYPIPANWKPIDETFGMMERSEAYIRSQPDLSKVLGSNWKISREQAWYWEANFLEARAKGTEKLWLQEMPCVTGDTRVSTEQGIIRIDQAATARATESGTVSAWLPKGPKRIFELHTKDGRILRGTSDHRIRSGETWKALGQFHSGDKVSLTSPMFAAEPHSAHWNWMPGCEMRVPVTKDFARLLGYFMGDGSFHAGVFEVSVDEKDTDVFDDVSRLIKSFTGKPPTVKKQGKMHRVQSSSVRWLEVLKGLGCVQPAIHKNLNRQCGWKRKVCIPDCIWRSPKSHVKEFLSALFECDGHAYRDAARVVLFSKHEDFLRDVQLLLLGFGIRGRFAAPERKKLNGNIYTGRTLGIGAAFANQFYESIGFISKRKQNGGKRRDSKAHSWGVNTGFEDEAVAVIDTGCNEPVYDLTIAVTHRFSANGILVHNCDDREAFQSSYDNVFGREVIAEIDSRRRSEYHVYAIVGQSIESRHEPDEDDIDHEMPIIPVRFTNRKGMSYRWELVPLNWEEWFENVDGIKSDDDEHMGKFFVWLEPEPGYRYAIGIRTGTGIGIGETVISVSRRARNVQECDEQAAEFRSADVSHVEAFPFAMAIAAYYSRYTSDLPGKQSQPYVAIEQVESVGDTVYTQMRKLGYRNFHKMTRYDSKASDMKQSSRRKVGWYSYAWASPIYTDTFVLIVRNGWFKVNSPFTLYEMDKWEAHVKGESGKVKYLNSEGVSDAGLLAAALAAFCVNDTKSLTDRTEKRFMANASSKPVRLDITPTLDGTTFPLSYTSVQDEALNRAISRFR